MTLGKGGIGLRLSLGFISVGMVLLTAIFLGGKTYRATQEILRENLRTRMADIIAITALSVDVAAHSQIQSPEDERTPSYLAIKKTLQKIRNTSPDIRFLYTCRQNAQGEIVFVVDAEDEHSKDVSHVGDVYPDPSPVLLEAFKNPSKIYVEQNFYTDKWGVYLSSYAPIISPSGQFEAMIGMDLTADTVMTYEGQHLTQILLMIVFFSVLTAGASWEISRRIARSLIALERDMSRIQHLDLTGHCEVRSIIKEISSMSETVETLKNSLRSFRRYVPADLVAELVELRQEAVLSAEPRNITLFFSDIAGFTTVSEQLEPGVLAVRLGDYFERVAKTILDHQGTVAQFIGDAVMAFWNAPRPNEAHALQACRAALRCQKELDALAREWEGKGYPLFPTRIGLCTGDAIVGNIGYTERMSYGALGDVVNLASRIEGLNKFFGTRILIGETTHAIVHRQMATRLLGMVAVKGRVNGVRVYELVSETGDTSPHTLEFLENFNSGMGHYAAQEWSSAMTCFETCTVMEPLDGLSRNMLEQCKNLLDNPPHEEWNGTIIMHEK